jgi:hypothetical protein
LACREASPNASSLRADREPADHPIVESVLSDFNGLRRHFRVGSPPLNPKPWSVLAHESREPSLSLLSEKR